MQAVDMDFAIAANVFGQDVAVPPTYSGNIDEDNQAPGTTTATLQLTSGDGPSSVKITIGDTVLADCAVGTFTSQTPFAPGTQVVWQSPDSAEGQRFDVLADCGGNLIVSGGGLLLTNYPQDGDPLAAGLVNTHDLTGSDVWWTNLVSPTAAETAFDQTADGDIHAAINAYPDGDRGARPGYLSWTRRRCDRPSGLRDCSTTSAPRLHEHPECHGSDVTSPEAGPSAGTRWAANTAPCGSASTVIRTGSTSNGGTMIVPPRRSVSAAIASASSTANVTLHRAALLRLRSAALVDQRRNDIGKAAALSSAAIRSANSGLFLARDAP